MNAVETLMRAKELLFDEGWSPNAERGPLGPRCLYWALIDAEAKPRDERVRSAYSFVKEAVGADSVTDWNDMTGRTFGEVVDVLDRAVKLAEIWEIVP